MIRFENFTYSWSYDVATSVRDEIYGEDALVPVREFWRKVDESFVKRAVAPQPVTYLHELVAFSLRTSIEYMVRKWDYEDSRSDLRGLLADYQIPHVSYDDFGARPEDKNYEYSQYLSRLVEEQAAAKVADEVFTLLFPDRQLLREMNEIIASTVRSLKKLDYPELLTGDGVVRRCRHWPKWVINGIFYRDTGHCSLCGKDLTGLLASGVEPAVDHIVPLKLGGTNDPTNLQLLCKPCNSSKGGNGAVTSSRRHMYW